jgi:hypothetical protein
MLHEILKGQATLEPPRETAPYREPSAPQRTQRCIGCNEWFSTPVTAVALRCPTCALAESMAYAANTPEAIQRFNEAQRRRAWLYSPALRVTGLVVVAAAVALVRFGMRDAIRESRVKAAGYRSYADYEDDRKARAVVYPTDAYSEKIRSLAYQMCQCADLKCARDVRAALGQYMSRNSATDDTAEQSAAADMDKLFACQAEFEAR